MTNYKIQKLPFNQEAVSSWSQVDQIGANWPIVYTLSNDKEIYVGETLSASARLNQHLHSKSKQSLEHVKIIINERFNKSVCLDIESHLIRYFAADGTHRVLNANAGISDSNYFEREKYRETFDELFDLLVKDGLLSRPVPEIVNSNLFKFSPFTSLTSEQAAVLSGILEQLAENFSNGQKSKIVLQGDPGTGKTILAIYLMKLLRDIGHMSADDLLEQDSVFAEFFTPEFSRSVLDLKIGLVVPQQALRKTLQTVFNQTPGLDKNMVLTPFEVAASKETYDFLVVDEAHRLGQRSNQAAAMQNKKFTDLNKSLYGFDDVSKTQLNWIESKSKHQLLMLDTAQSIKPADLPLATTQKIVQNALDQGCLFQLASQMRVTGGKNYLRFVSALLTDSPEPSGDFNGYDLRFYDDFSKMRADILALDSRIGLCRILAGFAWEWKSKRKPELMDIEIEGVQLQWNQTATDWVNSPTSPQEVGSIHTIQGYDLNYAGVVIANDLGYDPVAKRIVFRRENYFDVKGKENNNFLNIKYTDEEILQWVTNIYRVLLTRGIKGTFIYVCDPELRKVLKKRLEYNV